MAFGNLFSMPGASPRFHAAGGARSCFNLIDHVLLTPMEGLPLLNGGGVGVGVDGRWKEQEERREGKLWLGCKISEKN